MREMVCKAFCDAIEVRSVPAGYAIKAPYTGPDGDPIILYAVPVGQSWRIEDDGTQVAYLEACGVDLDRHSRGDAFKHLLKEYGALYDPETQVLTSASINKEQIGDTAVAFTALLLRLQDIALLSTPHVRNAFREDAISAIHRRFDPIASVQTGAASDLDLQSQHADVVLRSSQNPPLAVFLGTTEERALHALVSKMEAESYKKVKFRVALLIERAKSNPVREGTYALAQSRLDGVLSFRGSENDAMDRLALLAGIDTRQLVAASQDMGYLA